MRHRIISALVIGVTLAVATAVPASATQRNCSSSARMCVYYNSSSFGLGAEFGTDVSVPSFNPNKTTNDISFKAGPHGTSGAGRWVWNGAAALRNSRSDLLAVMFEDPYNKGAYDVVEQKSLENLVRTKNDNASLSLALP